MAGKYDEAVADYKEYLKEFPKGASAEDVNYRIALTALFGGKYEDAMNQLEDYLEKYQGRVCDRCQVSPRRLQIRGLALR